MELTYQTPKIRMATADGKAARKMLGEDLARAFHGVVADMRDAMFLAEVPGTPDVETVDGKTSLTYRLNESALLRVEPLGVADAAAWDKVHRIKLVRITREGKVLA